MECNRCGGNGKYTNIFGDTVRCDFCYGTGEIEYGEDDKIVPTGKLKSKTNEEWIKSMNTEQLAEWLNNKIIICAVCDQQKICGYFINETCHLCPCHEGKNKSWEVWLKQPHTNE